MAREPRGLPRGGAPFSFPLCVLPCFQKFEFLIRNLFVYFCSVQKSYSEPSIQTSTGCVINVFVSYSNCIVNGQRLMTFASSFFNILRTLPKRLVGISGCPSLLITYTYMRFDSFHKIGTFYTLSRYLPNRYDTFANVPEAFYSSNTAPNPRTFNYCQQSRRPGIKPSGVMTSGT